MKRIKSIDIIDLKIPFKISFKHNSANRSVTQAIIVVVSDGAMKGYGEGCPREYVTNENIRSAINFLEEVKTKIMDAVYNVSTMIEFKSKNANVIEKNPSAWCAIELSLLDLFAKQDNCSIEKLIGLSKLKGIFKYTAVIGDDNFDRFISSAKSYNKLGFSDYKIKISGNITLDKSKLSYLRSLNSNSRVRLDANNLWTNYNEVINYVNELPYDLFGIEEPLKERSIFKLKELAGMLPLPVILDESFTSIEQLKELHGRNEHFILNLRVSKLGGLLNTLLIAKTAKELGIRIIIGAQVGETSILTRAGLCVANTLEGSYLAMEGAFGTILLEKDIVDEPLMFQHGGLLDTSKQIDNTASGLGLKITI